MRRIFENTSIYWINSAKDLERINHMEKQFNGLNHLKIDIEDKINPNRMINTIIHANMQAIKKAWNNNLPYVIIFEDKCHFDYVDYFPLTINEIIATISRNNDNWQVIQLASVPLYFDLTDYKKNGFQIRKLSAITEGLNYLINRTGMEKILKVIIPNGADSFDLGKIQINSFEEILFGELIGYVINLPLCCSYWKNPKPSELHALHLYRDFHNKENMKRVFANIDIYWINLDSSIDRANNMFKQLENVNHTRISAIDGTDPVKLKATYNILNTNPKYTLALNCVMCSHMKAIKTAFDKNLPYVIILEDKCHFDLIGYYRHTMLEIIDLCTNIDNDWELIHLYSAPIYENLENYKHNGINLYARGKKKFSSLNYLVNRRGMEKLLAQIPIDGNTYNMIKFKNYGRFESFVYGAVNTYVINCPPFYTYSETSTFDRYFVNNLDNNKKTNLTIQLVAKNLLYKYYSLLYKSFELMNLTLDENHNRKKTFEQIYDSNHWYNTASTEGSTVQTESKSGGGSTLTQTAEIRNQIPVLLKNLNIKTMLDASCGDFNWMKHVDLDGVSYTGIDIVSSLIHKNNEFYGNPNVKFLSLDIVKDDLPKNDLILCRDCLVHLPYEDVINAVKNFKKSGSTYLLTTTFSENRKNIPKMKVGNWHPLNLVGAPFNFPQPILTINEKCTEGENKYSDKSLVLWKLDDIAL